MTDPESEIRGRQVSIIIGIFIEIEIVSRSTQDILMCKLYSSLRIESETRYIIGKILYGKREISGETICEASPYITFKRKVPPVIINTIIAKRN